MKTRQALLTRQQIDSVEGLTRVQREQLLRLCEEHDHPTGVVHRNAFEQVKCERDEALDRLRATAQILISEIGADGPTNAEAVAAEAVQLIKNLRIELAQLHQEEKSAKLRLAEEQETLGQIEAVLERHGYEYGRSGVTPMEWLEAMLNRKGDTN